MRESRVLVVERDPESPESLTALLATSGYDVTGATEADALDALGTYRPTLILLEQELGRSAVEDCMLYLHLRSSCDVPMIAVSAPRIDRRPVAATVALADASAADRPDIPDRLYAALRKALVEALDGNGQLAVGTLVIDFDRRRVRRGAQEIRLTPKEFALVACLARQANCVVSTKAILIALWGASRGDHRQKLWTLVRKIRAKLEPDPARPRYVISEPQVGYRLSADAAAPVEGAAPRPLSAAR